MCKRVLPCVSMCGGGEPHTRAACESSVFWTRGCVCKAQDSERGRGGGEDEAVAKPGAHIRNREIGKSGLRDFGKSGNRETHGAHKGNAMRPRIFSTHSSCSRRKDKASAAYSPPPR